MQLWPSTTFAATNTWALQVRLDSHKPGQGSAQNLYCQFAYVVGSSLAIFMLQKCEDLTSEVLKKNDISTIFASPNVSCPCRWAKEHFNSIRAVIAEAFRLQSRLSPSTLRIARSKTRHALRWQSMLTLPLLTGQRPLP